MVSCHNIAENGGLGVRNLYIANVALLMKWQWLWLQEDEDQAWWKHATPMENRTNMPWKNLKTIAIAFQCSIKHQVGNREKTIFWHDNWYDKPLKTTYSNLYHLVNAKQVSVAHCNQPTEWNLQHGPLTTTALFEKNELLNQLANFRITQSEDSVKWLRSPNTFSVQSAYNFLSHTPSPHSHMQNIWIIKAPLRVAIFAWLLLNNRLATIDNLVKKGWCLPNMCIMCRASEENAMHLVQHCFMAKKIRAYIATTCTSNSSLPPRYTASTFASMLTDSKKDLTAKRWEITICFVLWREKYRRLFSAKDAQPMQLVREIRLKYRNWFQCCT